MAIELTAVLDADNKPADWTDRNLEPAARAAARHERQLQLASAPRRCPIAPPLQELNDVPDERGGGATRNGYAIYDLPRHRLIHHLLPRRAAAHLVAARARRLGQCVRDRVASSTSWRRSPARTR